MICRRKYHQLLREEAIFGLTQARWPEIFASEDKNL